MEGARIKNTFWVFYILFLIINNVKWFPALACYGGCTRRNNQNYRYELAAVRTTPWKRSTHHQDHRTKIFFIDGGGVEGYQNIELTTLILIKVFFLRSGQFSSQNKFSSFDAYFLNTQVSAGREDSTYCILWDRPKEYLTDSLIVRYNLVPTLETGAYLT